MDDQSNMHEVKSWPEFFEPVWSGDKPFDIRKNDRGYKVGDRLYMREWDEKAGYTGRECTRRITYVLDGAGSVGTILPLKGLSTGYAVLGLRSIPTRCSASVATDPPQDCGYPWCSCDAPTVAVMNCLNEEGLVIVPRQTLDDLLELAAPNATPDRLDAIRKTLKSGE